MNKFILGVVLSLYEIIAMAQMLSPTTNEKGKAGYADESGQIVIPCNYDDVFPFEDGMARVTKGGKIGYIKEDGSFVIPLKYTEITPWGNNLFRVSAGGKKGIISKDGAIIVKPAYSNISPFNEYGLAWVSKGGKPGKDGTGMPTYMQGAKFGIINSSGKIIAKPSYAAIYEFAENCEDEPMYGEGKKLLMKQYEVDDKLLTDCKYVGISKDQHSEKKAGLLNTSTKKIVIPIGAYDYIMQPQSNMVRFYKGAGKKATEIGYVNLETKKTLKLGKIRGALLSQTTMTHGDFINELAPYNNETWSFIDKKGTILRTGFSDIDYSDATKMWVARKKDSCAVFDTYNNDVFKEIYQDANLPHVKTDSLYFAVCKNGKWGIINRKEEKIIDFIYDYALAPKYGMITIKIADKCGVINLKNEQVVPAEYIEIFPNEENTKYLWAMKKDSLYHVFDVEKKTSGEEGYEFVTNFDENGLAWAHPKEYKIPDVIAYHTQVGFVDQETAQRRLEAARKSENRATRRGIAKSLIKGGVFGALKKTIKLNRKHQQAETTDFSEESSNFGIIIGCDGKKYFDMPVALNQIENVRELIVKNGNKPLTKGQARKAILKMTSNQSSFLMTKKIDKENWDY